MYGEARTGATVLLEWTSTILVLLFVGQLIFVPGVARRRGRDGAVWFFITFIWLFLTGGLTWLFCFVPISAAAMAATGQRIEGDLIVGFLLAAGFGFLPLILASRPRTPTQPTVTFRPRRRSSFARRRAARRYR